jgi:hypothetical protein
MRDRIADSTLVKVVTPQLSSGPLGNNCETNAMNKILMHRYCWQLFLLTFIFSLLPAQARMDVIHFKSGGKAVGEIVGKVVGKSLQLKLQSGEILSIHWDSIKDIDKTTVDTSTHSTVPNYIHQDTIASTLLSARDSLVFKNGTIIAGNIKSLNPWSVTLDNDNYYALKMLSEIEASDSSIVPQLKSFYPDIVVTKTDSMFVIELATLKLLPVDEYGNNFVYRYFVLFDAMSARAENIEFQINLIPRFCHNIVGQVAVSSGTDLTKTGIRFQQASIGVGYLYSFRNVSLSANFILADKTLFPDYFSHVVTYCSIYMQVLFGNRWLLSMGGRYHISNIPIDNEKTRFSFNLGMGYNFQITPN